MSYATLMVYVDPERIRENILHVGRELADRFSAKVLGASAMAIRPPVIANGVVVDAITQAEISRMVAKLAEAERWFRQVIENPDRAVEWHSALDVPTEFLLADAHLADLIVISANRGSGYSSVDAGSVALRSGRPVLVVPADVRSLKADRIVVGWTDSREARRALQDALPFLHEATQVTICEVCEDGEEDAAQRRLDGVAKYLGRHHIKAAGKVLGEADGSVAHTVVRLAQHEGADLLVTGAYGHSRLGEWIFGGVTRDLLALSPICCLMSH